MSNGYSGEEFINFMDYLANKGLLKKATARGRKAAVTAFLGVLDDDEKLDIRGMDIDSLAMRFANLQSDNFTPKSLTTYKSRFNSAYKDFLSYRENPLGFSPAINQRNSSSKNTKPLPIGGSESSSKQHAVPVTENFPDNQMVNEIPDTILLPIPLRKGLIVKIANLPTDLTSAEADRLSCVILALAIN